MSERWCREGRVNEYDGHRDPGRCGGLVYSQASGAVALGCRGLGGESIVAASLLLFMATGYRRPGCRHRRRADLRAVGRRMIHRAQSRSAC